MFLNPVALFLSAVSLSLLGSAAAQDKVCRLEEVDAAMTVRYVSVVSSEYVFIARHFLFRDQNIYEVKINWTAKTIGFVKKIEITKYWPGWKGTKVTRTFSFQYESRRDATAVIGDHQHTTLARFDKDTLELIAGSNRSWNFDSLSQVVVIEKNTFNRDRPLTDETRAFYSYFKNGGEVVVFNYPMPSGSTQKKNYSTIPVVFTEESDKLFEYEYMYINMLMDNFLSNFNWNEMKMIGVLPTEIRSVTTDSVSASERKHALIFLVQHGNRMYNCFGVIGRDIATCTQLAEYQETEIWLDTVDCEKLTPKPIQPSEKTSKKSTPNPNLLTVKSVKTTPKPTDDSFPLELIIALIAGIVFVVMLINCFVYIYTREKKSGGFKELAVVEEAPFGIDPEDESFWEEPRNEADPMLRQKSGQFFRR